MELSKRLQAIADMVTPGVCVADVGCDHGFVSIYLYEKQIAPKVIAMDLRPGPLQRAKEHIETFGYGSYIETRLSDGVTALKPGEADAMICAGMGGRLMAKILEDGYEKVVKMKEMILQPQSDLLFFREFLRNHHLYIVQEDMVKEDGKYYPMMKVLPEAALDVKKKQEFTEAVFKGMFEEKALQNKAVPEMTEKDFVRIQDSFGPYLLRDRHPVLKEFLEVLLERNQTILAGIRAGEGESRNDKRIEALKLEIKDIVYCLSLYGV